MLAIALVVAATLVAHVASTGVNLLVNGGCEASGGSACATNTVCGGAALWKFPTSAGCGQWCTGDATQVVTDFNGWTQTNAFTAATGIGCVYLNITESAAYGGAVIGSPYEGSSFFSMLTSECATSDTNLYQLAQNVTFSASIYPAITAGLVTHYMFAAGSSANNSVVQVNTVYFSNNGAVVVSGNTNLFLGPDAGPIPGSILWTTAATTFTVPVHATSLQVRLSVATDCTGINQFGGYVQLDDVIAYMYSSACIGLPTFPTGQTNTTNCSSTYTLQGDICTLQCLPGYIPSGGNFTAVCNSTWTPASQVFNNWVVGTGTCAPAMSASNSHSTSHKTRSHSTSHKTASHKSRSHKSHSHMSKSHHSESRSTSHKSHSHKSHSHMSKSHHSDSNSHESNSQSAAVNTFESHDLTALIIVLPILGCLILACIFALLYTRRYRQRRVGVQ